MNTAGSHPDDAAAQLPMVLDSKDWEKALQAEDSRKVRKLFNRKKELLRETWAAESDADPQKILKGRTALHVAARRGNIDLVEEILQWEGPKESHLLEVIDVDYELDALAMAVVSGNWEIVNLLKKASREMKSNPYNIGEIPAQEGPDADDVDSDKEAALKAITNDALSEDYEAASDLYGQDCDFNFLDISLYFFHFTFSTWDVKKNDKLTKVINNIQEKIFSEARKEKRLLEYLLLELWDGQGRPALHVAVDSRKVNFFLQLIKRQDHHNHGLDHLYMNVKDSVGRTPLYRAAAKNNLKAVTDLVSNRMVNVSAQVVCLADQWGGDLDIDSLSKRNAFKSDCVYITERKLKGKAFNNETNSQDGPGHKIDSLEKIHSTALHVAIIHQHERIVDKLLKVSGSRPFPPNETEDIRKGKKFPRSSIPSQKVNINGQADDHSTSRLSPCSMPTRNEVETTKALDCAADDHSSVQHQKADSSSKAGEANCPDISHIDCHRRFTWPVERDFDRDEDVDPVVRQASPMHLAVLAGSIPICRKLLEHQESKAEEHSISQSFLLAAAKGIPGMIKVFLDSKQGKFDQASKVDDDGNTALHLALKGKSVLLHPHLVDFVGCDHVYRSRWVNKNWVSQWLASPEEIHKVSTDEVWDNRKTQTKRKCGQRMGSVSLLLQAGSDIWKQNNDKKTPTPELDADEELVKWWYEKVAKHTQRIQKDLNAAANSISVTAALVATASFLGPLQPPLGYVTDPSSAQVGISAVRTFVVCDSLSFYFALAAIMLALVPSLPMPQESMFRELVVTRIIVAIAVTLLFPAIFFVLLAFAAAYIAVVPEHGLAHSGLSLSTLLVGGFVCLVVMIAIFIRLMKVVTRFPTDCWVEVRRFLKDFFLVDAVYSLYKKICGNKPSRGSRVLDVD